MPPKKIPLSKKLILIGGALIIFQAIYIALFSTDDKKITVKDAITTQVSNNPAIASDRKDLVRLQLALSSFKLKNKIFPKQLSELVPDFIETVPLDPTTGVAFKYTVTGDRYNLGDSKPSEKGAKSGDTSEAQDEESQLLAYLDQKDEGLGFTYDSTGKKDPFRSHDFTARIAEEVGDTPLESYSYDELKLSAVLEGMEEARAIIEDPKGKGHMVIVGTKVGNLGGVVKQIESNKLTILEKRVEFTGEVSTRTIEMTIR